MISATMGIVYQNTLNTSDKIVIMYTKYMDLNYFEWQQIPLLYSFHQVPQLHIDIL